jgi:hypothetical protein
MWFPKMLQPRPMDSPRHPPPPLPCSSPQASLSSGVLLFTLFCLSWISRMCDFELSHKLCLQCQFGIGALGSPFLFLSLCRWHQNGTSRYVIMLPKLIGVWGDSATQAGRFAVASSPCSTSNPSCPIQFGQQYLMLDLSRLIVSWPQPVAAISILFMLIGFGWMRGVKCQNKV